MKHMRFYIDTETIRDLPRMERREAYARHAEAWRRLCRESAVHRLGYSGGIDAATLGRIRALADEAGSVDMDDALREVRNSRTQQAHAETQTFSYGSVGRWRGAVLDAALQTADVERIRDMAARHGVKPTREAVMIILNGALALDAPERSYDIASPEYAGLDCAEALIELVEERLGRILSKAQRAAIEFVYNNDGVEGADAAVRQTLSRLRRS